MSQSTLITFSRRTVVISELSLDCMAFTLFLGILGTLCLFESFSSTFDITAIPESSDNLGVDRVVIVAPCFPRLEALK